MRPKDRETGKQLKHALTRFNQTARTLPGIRNSDNLDAFVEQLVESIRRVRYVDVVKARRISAACADPQQECFDPIKAAAFHQRTGNKEEAFWLVFLFVHFGKHARGGWRYIRKIYGKCAEGGLWDWVATRDDVAGFRKWLHEHNHEVKNKGTPGGFGNHRKYESLEAYSENGTGAVIESYVEWINPPRTHEALINGILAEVANDRGEAFERLYESMKTVRRFGRTARFDYLTMLGKIGLADIAPASPHLIGATGPLKGAHLLFGSAKTQTELNALTIELGSQLGVGMQVMEDALCNWQKSPNAFKAFRG